jgi:hypothetical protein
MEKRGVLGVLGVQEFKEYEEYKNRSQNPGARRRRMGVWAKRRWRD